METNDSNKFLPAAVIAAGLLVAGAVAWNGMRSPGDGAPQTGDGPAANAAAIPAEGDPFIGRADAPLTIIEWTDFQCPFCKQFELDTMPQLIETYVDTGMAKVVFMDLVFLGNDSVDAALYNRAVWNLYPDRYLEWRHAMYEAQDDEGDRGFGDEASINELNASIAGIDAAKVAADVAANRSAYLAQMDADKAEASKLGIKATPSFVVGTKLLQGALPFASFKQSIETQLQ